MKLKYLFILCFAFIYSQSLSAQSDIDYVNTLSLNTFEDIFNESSFAYPDFVQANISQNKNSSKKVGLIQNKQVNYDRSSNTFYVLDNGNIYALNNEAINGVYVNRGHQFMKINKANPDAICEVIYMTEKIYVYLLDGNTYARVGDKDIQIERTCEAIEQTFDVSSKSINKYIAINGLNLRNIEDFKLVLRQYENSYYNNQN